MFNILIAVGGAIVVAMFLIYMCDNLEYPNDEDNSWGQTYFFLFFDDI